MRKAWEIDTHTFPMVCVLFSHPIPILWYTSAYVKCMGFPINFAQYGKMQQNPWYGENPGNWYSYFSHIMDSFVPLDSHSMVYFITWEMHVFSHKFSITWEKTAKPIKWGKSEKLVPGNILQNPRYVENLGNWYSCFSHRMSAFFSIRFTSYGILHNMRNKWVSPSISSSMGKCNEIHQITSAYEIGTHFFPNLWILLFHQIPIL